MYKTRAKWTGKLGFGFKVKGWWVTCRYPNCTWARYVSRLRLVQEVSADHLGMHQKDRNSAKS